MASEVIGRVCVAIARCHDAGPIAKRPTQPLGSCVGGVGGARHCVITCGSLCRPCVHRCSRLCDSVAITARRAWISLVDRSARFTLSCRCSAHPPTRCHLGGVADRVRRLCRVRARHRPRQSQQQTLAGTAASNASGALSTGQAWATPRAALGDSTKSGAPHIPEQQAIAFALLAHASRAHTAT